jgi:PKD repeat protein
MKIRLYLLLVFVAYTLCSISVVYAQDSISNKNTFQRAIMKKDGLSDTDIDRWVMTRKLISEQEKNTKIQTIPVQSPKLNANSCGDMGGENGWSGWQASVGDYSSNPQPNPTSSSITYSQTNIAPSTLPLRFILTNTGSDSCTPGPIAGSPLLPVVAPGFGNFSIQMGQRLSNGVDGGCNRGCVEKLTYSFTVTPADTNFIYTYAFVMSNRLSSSGQPEHAAKEVPFAEIFILDQNGDVILCSHQKYMGDTLGQTTPTPGLYATQSACARVAQSEVYYKPWAVVGVDLAKYIGQTVTVNIINSDCSLGGHFCHSYWDFKCGNNSFSTCKGAQSLLCAPTSYWGNANPYTYEWYKNRKPYGSPIATSQCINPISIPGDTFSVKVHQNPNCDFYMNYVPSIDSMEALFTYSANDNVISFANLSTANISNAWSFGDGNTSTQQNPIHAYAAMGTYTACLVARDSICTDTACKVIVISVVGIHENDLNTFVSVFPNPASKNIFLDFGGKNFGKAEVSINNLIGEKRYKINTTASGKQLLDISNLPNGIYFVKIETDYGSLTKKIIINR